MAGKKKNIKAIVINHGPHKGRFAVNVDPVLARCGGLFSKADYSLPPYGVLSCATFLNSQSIPAEVVDFCYERLHGEKAQQRLAALAGNVLVHTPTTSTLKQDLAFCRTWKEGGGNRLVVSTGTHATVEPQSVVPGPGWVAVRGEPEQALADCLQAWSPGQGGKEAWKDVPGLTFHDGAETVHNPDRTRLPDLDMLPFPDRGLLAENHYSPPFARPGRFDFVVTSRGCPFGCTFCASQAYYGCQTRFRSLDHVMEEIHDLRDRFGVSNVGVWDDTFTMNQDRVMEFCGRVGKLKPGLNWLCLSRVDTVDRPMLRAMARAGCYQIQFGVESASPGLRKVLGKNTTIAQVEQAFAWTREAGIRTAAFFMMGIPGETGQDRRATVNLARKLAPDFVSFNVCTPLPGSRLYAELTAQGRAPEKDRWEKLDGGGAGDWLHSPEEVREINRAVHAAYRRFYFHPAFLARSLKSIRKPSEFLRLGRAGLAIFKKNWR